MAGERGGALLAERGGALLAERGAALLAERATAAGSDAVEGELSSSGSNTGATCMTALVRAERRAARTTSRNKVSSICAV